MISTLSNVLPVVGIIIVCIALSFVPNLWAKARGKWPGLFETNNPVPDAMPESWMAIFTLAVMCIVAAGVIYGAFAAVLAIYAAVFIAVILIHVPPYVIHQWRRMRGHTPPPVEC